MKKFSTSIYGYSKSEVNAFVRDVAKEYESMLNNLKQRDAEITSLKQKLVQYQNMESTLNKAIMVAEDASNQIKRMARDESKSIVDDAKRNASRIVNEALLKAEKLLNSRQRLRANLMNIRKCLKFSRLLKTELKK